MGEILAQRRGADENDAGRGPASEARLVNSAIAEKSRAMVLHASPVIVGLKHRRKTIGSLTPGGAMDEECLQQNRVREVPELIAHRLDYSIVKPSEEA